MDLLVLQTILVVVARNVAVVLPHVSAVDDGKQYEEERQHRAKERLDALRQSRPRPLPRGPFGGGLGCNSVHTLKNITKIIMKNQFDKMCSIPSSAGEFPTGNRREGSTGQH